MTKKEYEALKLLVAEIESLKGIIAQLTTMITNEASGITVSVKGQTSIDIPLAMSPLRAVKKQLQDELDIKQTYFAAITYTLPTKAGI